MTMQSDVLVETADAEDLWWDDADAEDNRLRKLGAKACGRLLALLQQLTSTRRASLNCAPESARHELTAAACCRHQE